MVYENQNDAALHRYLIKRDSLISNLSQLFRFSFHYIFFSLISNCNETSTDFSIKCSLIPLLCPCVFVYIVQFKLLIQFNYVFFVCNLLILISLWIRLVIFARLFRKNIRSQLNWVQFICLHVYWCFCL